MYRFVNTLILRLRPETQDLGLEKGYVLQDGSEQDLRCRAYAREFEKCRRDDSKGVRGLVKPMRTRITFGVKEDGNDDYKGVRGRRKRRGIETILKISSKIYSR